MTEYDDDSLGSPMFVFKESLTPVYSCDTVAKLRHR